MVVPLRELEGAWGLSADQIRDVVEDQFRAYQTSLSADRRLLLERFSIVDMARKVVGVGSVGTRAWMVLLEGRDSGDPLFLQVKEATRSVLEDHLPKTRFHTPGQRVVEGQRLMQAASDIFLGWTKGVQDDRFYYWRQLRDMKASAVVETMTPFGMTFYARMCGWTLARAHARSGDPVAIAAYLGTDDGSTRRSPSSPHGTPTRTAATTKPSSKPSRTAGSTPSKESETAMDSLGPPDAEALPIRPVLPRGLMIAVGVAAVLVAALGLQAFAERRGPRVSRARTVHHRSTAAPVACPARSAGLAGHGAESGRGVCDGGRSGCDLGALRAAAGRTAGRLRAAVPGLRAEPRRQRCKPPASARVSSTPSRPPSTRES